MAITYEGEIGWGLPDSEILLPTVVAFGAAVGFVVGSSPLWVGVWLLRKLRG